MSSVEAISKSSACLRVILHGVKAKPPKTDLDALIGKLINAFLETRWIWPRQFSALTPFTYVLSDPRAPLPDKPALQTLSCELQLKLFGLSSAGEVILLWFEGDELDVHRFAELDADALNKLLNGEASEVFPPFAGQFSRVTAKGFETIDLNARPAAPAEAKAVSFSSLKFEPHYEPVYRGLYFPPSRRFFGNIALCKPLGAPSLRDQLAGAEVLNGVRTEDFDEGCVESAVAALSQARVEGQLFVPLNFSSLIRPARRNQYAAFFERLPAPYRAKLVAAIYETPRDPSFFALGQARQFLSRHFGHVNLFVSDPAFQVDKLAAGVVGGVTLVLPEADPPARLSALRAFMSQRETFRRKQLWPGVSRVASRAELDLCLATRVAAVSGPAVSDITFSPLGAGAREIDDLPLRATIR
jgi:hypothetical protein